MRIILILWAAPMFLFWGWYGLSANDINFGTAFFSREIHDLVFNIYGQVLGVPGAEVPAMVASACAFDTSIVLAIAAFRWRDDWYPQTREWVANKLSRGNASNIADEVTVAPFGPMQTGE
ncbi:MAG: DUF6105 family protein [Nitratireductor sp.]